MRAQEQGGEVTVEHLGRLYVFSLMWSVGAVLEPDGRRRVEQWLRSREMLALDLPPLAGPDDSMFDYYVGSDGESWASICPSQGRPFFLPPKCLLFYLLALYLLLLLLSRFSRVRLCATP